MELKKMYEDVNSANGELDEDYQKLKKKLTLEQDEKLKLNNEN